MILTIRCRSERSIEWTEKLLSRLHDTRKLYVWPMWITARSAPQGRSLKSNCVSKIIFIGHALCRVVVLPVYHTYLRRRWFSEQLNLSLNLTTRSCACCASVYVNPENFHSECKTIGRSSDLYTIIHAPRALSYVFGSDCISICELDVNE